MDPKYTEILAVLSNEERFQNESQSILDEIQAGDQTTFQKFISVCQLKLGEKSDQPNKSLMSVLSMISNCISMNQVPIQQEIGQKILKQLVQMVTFECNKSEIDRGRFMLGSQDEAGQQASMRVYQYILEAIWSWGNDGRIQVPEFKEAYHQLLKANIKFPDNFQYFHKDCLDSKSYSNVQEDKTIQKKKMEKYNFQEDGMPLITSKEAEAESYQNAEPHFIDKQTLQQQQAKQVQIQCTEQLEKYNSLLQEAGKLMQSLKIDGNTSTSVNQSIHLSLKNMDEQIQSFQQKKKIIMDQIKVQQLDSLIDKKQYRFAAQDEFYSTYDTNYQLLVQQQIRIEQFKQIIDNILSSQANLQSGASQSQLSQPAFTQSQQPKLLQESANQPQNQLSQQWNSKSAIIPNQAKDQTQSTKLQPGKNVNFQSIIQSGQDHLLPIKGGASTFLNSQIWQQDQRTISKADLRASFQVPGPESASKQLVIENQQLQKRVQQMEQLIVDNSAKQKELVDTLNSQLQKQQEMINSQNERINKQTQQCVSLEQSNEQLKQQIQSINKKSLESINELQLKYEQMKIENERLTTQMNGGKQVASQNMSSKPQDQLIHQAQAKGVSEQSDLPQNVQLAAGFQKAMNQQSGPALLKQGAEQVSQQAAEAQKVDEKKKIFSPLDYHNVVGGTQKEQAAEQGQPKLLQANPVTQQSSPEASQKNPNILISPLDGGKLEANRGSSPERNADSKNNINLRQCQTPVMSQRSGQKSPGSKPRYQKIFDEYFQNSNRPETITDRSNQNQALNNSPYTNLAAFNLPQNLDFSPNQHQPASDRQRSPQQYQGMPFFNQLQRESQEQILLTQSQRNKQDTADLFSQVKTSGICQQRFKISCLKAKYLVHETESLQVGIISSVERNAKNANQLLRCKLFVTNKTAQQFTNIAIHTLFKSPDNDVLIDGSDIQELGAKQQKKVEVEIQNHTARYVPVLITINLENEVVPLAMPNVIARLSEFSEPPKGLMQTSFWSCPQIQTQKIAKRNSKICKSPEDLFKYVSGVTQLDDMMFLGIKDQKYDGFKKFGSQISCTLPELGISAKFLLLMGLEQPPGEEMVLSLAHLQEAGSNRSSDEKLIMDQLFCNLVYIFEQSN